MDVLQRNQKYKLKIYTCTIHNIYIHTILLGRKLNCIYFTIFCRHFLGEELDSLTLKELQNLEQQLDSALKHTRSRKVKSMNSCNNILSFELTQYRLLGETEKLWTICRTKSCMSPSQSSRKRYLLAYSYNHKHLIISNCEEPLVDHFVYFLFLMIG